MIEVIKPEVHDAFIAKYPVILPRSATGSLKRHQLTPPDSRFHEANGEWRELGEGFLGTAYNGPFAMGVTAAVYEHFPVDVFETSPGSYLMEVPQFPDISITVPENHLVLPAIYSADGSALLLMCKVSQVEEDSWEVDGLVAFTEGDGEIVIQYVPLELFQGTMFPVGNPNSILLDKTNLAHLGGGWRGNLY